METTVVISRIKDIDILSIGKENEMIPIRPLCDIIGVDFEGQRQRIERDPIIGSTAFMIKAVAADNKEREMFSIPFMYVFGWLFTIDVSRVKEEARESVINYKKECYQVLFRHYTDPQSFLQQKQELLEELVTDYQLKQTALKTAKNDEKEAKNNLDRVMKMTVDEWRANNRQLILPFQGEDKTD